MTTQEVADKLVQLCREGKNDQAIEDLYADDVVSRDLRDLFAAHHFSFLMDIDATYKEHGRMSDELFVFIQSFFSIVKVKAMRIP